MAETQLPEEIRRLAKLLDDAVESGDIETVLSCFADECVVELPGAMFEGKAGVKRAGVDVQGTWEHHLRAGQDPR